MNRAESAPPPLVISDQHGRFCSPPLSQSHPHRHRIALDEAIGPGRLVILVQQVPDGNLQIQAGDADIADGRTHIGGSIGPGKPWQRIEQHAV